MSCTLSASLGDVAGGIREIATLKSTSSCFYIIVLCNCSHYYCL